MENDSGDFERAEYFVRQMGLQPLPHSARFLVSSPRSPVGIMDRLHARALRADGKNRQNVSEYRTDAVLRRWRAPGRPGGPRGARGGAAGAGGGRGRGGGARRRGGGGGGGGRGGRGRL